MSVPLSSSYIDPEDLAAAGVDSRGNSINSANREMYGSQEDEAAGVTAMHSGYSPVGDDDGRPVSNEQAQPHFYDSWTGYCFCVNYILGVGVLGMPYAFYKGGYILSTLCLGLVTIMATFTALWLVDVSLRAQYIKRENRLLRGSVTMSNEPDQTIMYSAPHTAPVSTQMHHRYEMNELTQMFLGLKARRFYELLVIIYLVGALWSYSSVFSSSLASHIGLPGINEGSECDIYKDFGSQCTDLYLTYMGMFAVVVVPLTCLDLTEMKLMQIALAIFRFVSLTLMMVTSIYAIYAYPSPEADARSPEKAPFVSEGVVAFDWANLGLVFPIAIYSQIFHHSVPGLTHPLQNKSAAPRIFSGVLLTTMVLYTALGMTVAFYYGGYIPQTCTIAWASYTGGHDAPGESKPGWANFIGYLVVLFPPIDIISAFPLNAITLGNNLLCAFVEDERKQQMKKYKIPFRILAAAPPIIGAMIVKDLSVILKYTGCVGVLIAFVYPVFLQWKSRELCEKLSIKVESDESAGSNHEDEDLDVQRKLTAPTYSGKLVNHPMAMWIVLAFSMIGLIAVIVLSIAGLSN